MRDAATSASDPGRDGSRATCIMPGPVYPPMVYSGGISDELCDRRCHTSLLKIKDENGTIGWATVFPVSDEACDVTGVILLRSMAA